MVYYAIKIKENVQKDRASGILNLSDHHQNDVIQIGRLGLKYTKQIPFQSEAIKYFNL